MEKKRIEYLDAMRGFTMLLVVYSHIQYFSYHNVSLPWNQVFILFRMPLFFFASGFIFYNAERIWDKTESISFLKKKFMVQIAPTAIFLSIYAYMFDINLPICLCTPPKAGYWFTLSLFEYFFIYVVFISLFRKVSARNQELALMLCALTLYFFSGKYGRNMLQEIISEHTIGVLGIAQLRYFIFFAFGILVRQNWKYFQAMTCHGKAIGCVLALFFTDIIFIHPNIPATLPQAQWLLFIVDGLLGIVIVFTFFRKYESSFTKETLPGRSLQYIGRRTLDIYLLHFFFLPRNLEEIGRFFAESHNEVIELCISLSLSLIVIGTCLIISNVLRLSPTLAYILFGVKRKEQPST